MRLKICVLMSSSPNAMIPAINRIRLCATRPQAWGAGRSKAVAVAVTRAELGVILLGMAAGLGTAAALAAPLALALIPPAVLIPLELAVSGAAHRDLMAARARPAGGGAG